MKNSQIKGKNIINQIVILRDANVTSLVHTGLAQTKSQILFATICMPFLVISFCNIISLSIIIFLIDSIKVIIISRLIYPHEFKRYILINLSCVYLFICN